MGWFNRYRHSRGFGIHSPFAYRFVTEVIKEPLPYYDYDVLADPTDRLVYRIACRFNPSAIGATGTADVKAASMACPRAKICDEADLLICEGQYDQSRVADAIERHAVIVVKGINKKISAGLGEELDRAGYGMIFTNDRDMMIIVANPKLPRQTFSLRF